MITIEVQPVYNSQVTGNKIELRARIKDTNGRLSGTWEERTFNATGQVSGSVSPSVVNLRINGAVLA